METLKYQKEVTAAKDHKCNFCCQVIHKGEKYFTSTHKHDGEVYDWKSHSDCEEIAQTLKMYNGCDEEGLTQDHFEAYIENVHDDLLIDMLPKDDINNYSDIIQQFRKVRFIDKLGYVIRYYKKLKQKEEK